MLLSLILLAAVLEPKPEGARRIHARQVRASSYLLSGWNRFEQNYLPPYAADNDPSTAWVEGKKGMGEGEWLEWRGPDLETAKELVIYVQNGYQKSQKLWAANARPHKVRFEALRWGGGALPEVVGAPLDVELRDEQGYQEVVLTVPPAVGGFRLTLLSVRPGKVYDDTCISDLAVFVRGGDAYKSPVEAAMLQRIQTFAAERKRAAAAGEGGSRVRITGSYSAKTLHQGKLAAVPGDLPALLGELQKANPELAARLTKLTELPKQPGEGWTRVRGSGDPRVKASVSVALDDIYEGGLGLDIVTPFFDAGASRFLEESPQMRQDAKRLVAELATQKCNKACDTLASRYGVSCESACPCKCYVTCGETKACAKKCGVADPMESCGEEGLWAEMEDPTLSIEAALDGGTWVRGALIAPSALVATRRSYEGSREVVETQKREGVIYEQNLVAAAFLETSEEVAGYQSGAARLYAFDWRIEGATAVLARVVEVRVETDHSRNPLRHTLLVQELTADAPALAESSPAR